MGEGVEVVDGAFARLLDEALDHAPVQRTHELGMRLGQLAERAMGEGDHRDLSVVRAVNRRIEEGMLRWGTPVPSIEELDVSFADSVSVADNVSVADEPPAT